MLNTNTELFLFGLILNAYLIGVLFRILLLKSDYSATEKIFYIPVEIYRALQDLKTDRLSIQKLILVISNLNVCVYAAHLLSGYPDHVGFSYYFMQMLAVIICYNITALEFYFIRRIR